MTYGNTPVSVWKARVWGWADAERLRQHEDKVLLVLTLIIGAVVGLVIGAFILITENLGSRLYPPGSPAWHRVLIPVIGALVTGYLLNRYFPNARGSGIPQTKVALFLHDGRMRFRTVVGKFGCCAVSLASGIALGREGPSVQIGAGIASVLGQRLGLSAKNVRALVPIGAAAALAAAFNTPIAAVLFTMEEVMGDLHAPVLGSIVLSSATSWMVLHLILGDEPLFHVPAYQLVHPLEFLVYAALGVAGGLVSVCFVKLLLRQRRSFLAMPGWTQWLQPSVGGLAVGLMGWFVPQALGVGYGHVSEALNGKMPLQVMALLVIMKLVAAATCYASGNAGGIFGPSLFIGAMAGGAVGGVAHHLLPDYTGSIGAYALVGMGTAFAGIVRMPLTSVIMVFEMTRDYSIIVPVMISNLISYFISYRLQREPIYEALQHQDGIHLPPARSPAKMLLAEQAMRREAEVLSASESIADAIGRSGNSQQDAWPVVSEAGLVGMVTAAQLAEALERSDRETTLAEILPQPADRASLRADTFPHVHADQPIDTVLRRMAATGMNTLPVVNRANLRELQGVVSLTDIVAAYGQDEGQGEVQEPESGAAPASGTMLAGIIAATLGVLLLIGVLTHLYRNGQQVKAEQYFQHGKDLAREGRFADAVEPYRTALSLSHTMEHRLALGLALVSAGRDSEARLYLSEVLRADPTSGPANLGLARINAKEAKIQEAVDCYHRAIYGSWRERPQESQIQARFELAEFLGKNGAAKQASAELLGLLENAPADASLKKRVGHLLLDLGSPGDAAAVFRDLLRHDRRDAEASAALGQAEFALEDYSSAQEAFRTAVRLNPGDLSSRNRLDLCEQIGALDPTARSINSAERYRRSQDLLRLSLNALEQCSARGKALPDSSRGLMDRARKLVSSHKRPRSYSDAAEAGARLARDLWAARRELCGPAGASDEPVERVLMRVSR